MNIDGIVLLTRDREGGTYRSAGATFCSLENVSTVGRKEVLSFNLLGGRANALDGINLNIKFNLKLNL